MDHLHTVTRWEVFRNRRRILKNPLPFHRKNFEKYGDLFQVRIGSGTTVVFTRDAAAIRHILQKQHRKYEKSSLQTEDLAKYIGRGILTAEGEHWRTHRRMVQPAFHRKKLEGLLDIMRAAIEKELERILPGREEDVFPLMGDLAFQVVAKSLFSRNDIGERMVRLKRITDRNQRMLIREMRQPYLKWWFRLSGQIRKHLRHSEESRQLLNEIIEERVASRAEQDDLLDMLLNARYDDGTPMPRKQLIDEVLILFTAGHETTANALSFSLYLLARNPEVQEKLFLEVSQRTFDVAEQIRQPPGGITFLQQCIEEAMRLYPPVYVIDRVSQEDDSIGKFNFPGGTLFLLSIFELHRSVEFWEKPDLFMPERFSRVNRKALGDYYHPFGAGPRMCVGNNFAMYEMQMVLASIIRRYRVQSKLEQLSINPLISLKPGEVPLSFSLR